MCLKTPLSNCSEIPDPVQISFYGKSTRHKSATPNLIKKQYFFPEIGFIKSLSYCPDAANTDVGGLLYLLISEYINIWLRLVREVVCQNSSGESVWGGSVNKEAESWNACVFLQNHWYLARFHWLLRRKCSNAFLSNNPSVSPKVNHVFPTTKEPLKEGEIHYYYYYYWHGCFFLLLFSSVNFFYTEAATVKRTRLFPRKHFCVFLGLHFLINISFHPCRKGSVSSEEDVPEW